MDYRQDWMSDAQWECAQMYADLVDGFHHIAGKIKPFGYGIEINTWQNFATYDFDLLTRLVLLAHERCVRAEIGPSGPGRIKVMLHKRSREGGSMKRHPTMEEVIQRRK